MLLNYFFTVITNSAEFCTGPVPMHLVVPAPAVRKLEGVLFPWVFVWIRPPVLPDTSCATKEEMSPWPLRH